ncbi:MAG: toll/interleukin-1 receptor domain-containing protein [Ktedonobacteraceae bacterium]|nr:toll/interleukin-1 receptor domain-containing protein [Ktedonobacteraceae bacterium]
MPDTPISFFISHAHVDRAFVDRLTGELRARRFPAWVDHRGRKGDQDRLNG